MNYAGVGREDDPTAPRPGDHPLSVAGCYLGMYGLFERLVLAAVDVEEAESRLLDELHHSAARHGRLADFMHSRGRGPHGVTPAHGGGPAGRRTVAAAAVGGVGLPGLTPADGCERRAR